MKVQSFLNYEGQNSEIVATYILKELGYKIIHSVGLEMRKIETKRSYTHWSKNKLVVDYKKNGGKFKGDIICKMGKQYFIFEVKLKLFQENKNMNMFTATNNEIVDYTELTKSGKIPVKILINLKKDNEYYYGIFNWSDIKYSKNFNPKKTKSTSIRLADGLDISKLTKFENIKNYKFEKYLKYSHIREMQIDDRMIRMKKREAENENYKKHRKKIDKRMKSKIEKNWDHYTNHILSFLDSEKENFGKFTDDETNEKMVTQDAYSEYTGETGIRPLTRRYFFAVIRAMEDKKMLSGYSFSAF
jgi:hypothetical protein